MDQRKETNPEECRRREEAAIRLEQRFEDFLKAYDRNEAIKSNWGHGMERRLEAIEEFFVTVRGPFKAILWISGMVIASLLWDMGSHVFHLLRRITS